MIQITHTTYPKAYTMFTRLQQHILVYTAFLSFFAFTHTAMAQGTATGPASGVAVDPGPNVFIGSLITPIAIDLDPLGPPWTKGIFDPNGNVTAPGVLKMTETILNFGDEPWTDWHEIILDPPAGLPQSNWVDVAGLTVNGTSITFDMAGLGTPTLDLFNFSQPVLPGDIFVIEKFVEVYPTTGPMLRIEEYPTPEPASAALIGAGALLLLRRKH